jgi:CheY-like chemotaxis protein
MTKRYEIVHSSDDLSLMLIFPEGSWESLPFEVRLLCPWLGSELCGGSGISAAQRSEIAALGYSVAHAPAPHATICDEKSASLSLVPRSTPWRRPRARLELNSVSDVIRLGADHSVVEKSSCFAQKTVLVVEDEVFIRFDVTETLTSAGLHVIPVSTADEALEVLLLEVPIDLVFTDVRMPGSIDGLGLARRVQLERPHTKVVIASGHPQMPSDLVPAAFFGKPYPLAVVTDCIGSLLRS